MSDKKVFLAVDLGAESGRVQAGVYDGKTLELSAVNTFANGPIELAGSMHWNTTGLYSGILEGLKKAQEIYGDQLVSVGVDSWGVDYGLLDKNGHLLGIPYHYRDSRTEGMIEKAYDLMSKNEIYSRTGIQSMFFNTLYQLMAEVEENMPAIRNADCLLFTPDLINFWLTGQKYTEVTMASTGQIMNQETRDWDLDLLGKMGIPTNIFSSMIEPGQLVGTITGGAQKTIKCNDQLKVFTVGSHDTASAIAGIPVVGTDDFAFLSSGTWSLMGVELKNAMLTEESCELGFTNELGVDETVRYLKNINGLWIIQECRRHWLANGEEYDYTELTQMAVDAKPFNAIVDVDDDVFATIGEMPEKLADYCKRTGQKEPSNKGETLRAALEGLALKYREVLEDLRKLTGKKLDTLYIVGGGIQNRLLNQMAANSTGCKVVAGPVEATSIGNIVVQMMAAGELENLDQARQLIKDSVVPEIYEPQEVDLWNETYQKYLKMKQS